jgi:hypothetical protein
VPKKKPSRKAAGRAADPLSAKYQGIEAENEQLKQRTRQLEAECAKYREVLRKLMISRFTPEDLRRITADEDGITFLPLQQFVGELEAIVKGKRKKGA